MDKKIKDLDVLEAKLGSALRATGHLFPTTDREMEYFMEHIQCETVPEKYQTPDFVLREESHVQVKRASVKRIDYSSTAQRWSMAARNGKELPQFILDKMKEDKKSSQKK